MSNCFCVGKMPGCTCGGRCRCACTCIDKYKEFEVTTFEKVIEDNNDSRPWENAGNNKQPNCS